MILPQSMSFVKLDYLACSVAVFMLMGVTIWRKSRRSRLPYPPGPKGYPLIGNIYDMPKEQEWQKYMDWSEEYNSPIIHVNLAGVHLAILNSLDAVQELLEKRSAIYSDRPRLPMLGELVGWEIGLVNMRYGDAWRAGRRLFHQYFNPAAVPRWEPKITKGVNDLLHKLVESPDDFLGHISLFSGSTSVSIGYGMELKSHHEPLLLLINKAMEPAVHCGPGSFLVDSFPILKNVPDWMPGAGFKRKAKEWRKCVDDAVNIPFDQVKEWMMAGVCPPSVTAFALEHLRENPNDTLQEHDIRAATFTLYAAATDTTQISLQGWVLAMCTHPEVFQKARAELDRVVGQDRMPTFEDRDSLPYIDAMTSEVFRFNPAIPSGFGHRLTRDDMYNGYFLPAGTLVLGNTRAILYDKSIYGQDVDKFNPERFLKDGKMNPDVPPPNAAFGYGRRICPGQHLAHSLVFLTIACTIATLDISKSLDASGNPIEPKVEYTSGVVSRPMPFKCSIKPRSTRAAALIAEAHALNQTS